MLRPGVVPLLPALQTPVTEEAPHFVLSAWREQRCCPVHIWPLPRGQRVPQAVNKWGAPTWPFLKGQGLSEVSQETGGLPLASAAPSPCVLPGFHVHPSLLKGGMGTAMSGCYPGLRTLAGGAEWPVTSLRGRWWGWGPGASYHLKALGDRSRPDTSAQEQPPQDDSQ